jgi:hypothetical protein
VNEVKTKTIWRDQRSSLLYVIAEVASQRCVEQVSCRVIAHDVHPAVTIHRGNSRISFVWLTFDHFADMND